MKISEMGKWSSGLLILVLLVLAGCSERTNPKDGTFSLTPTLQPEITFTRIPTVKPSPTETATPIPTVTSSPTSLPTITPTSAATLETTQMFEAIQQFLTLGMDCQSPCFFGIIPGQSTLDQAINVFNWLRHPLWHAPDPEFYSSDFNYKDGIAFNVKLEIENNFIKNIELSIGLANYKDTTNRQLWQAFSPDALLKKYGPPSQVGFDLVASPSAPGSQQNNIEYNIILYFEPLSLTVEYGLGVPKDGNFLKICPLTDQYDGVGIYFGKDPANLPGFTLPLEKASSLNLVQFSDLMTQKSEPACFDISKEAFYPTP